MQFQVPQFIDTEAKIIGPLTIKQFLFLAAAAGLSFMLFFVLQTWLWFIMTAIFGSAAVAMAFVKIQGRSLPMVALSAFKFFWQPKLYLWRREEATSQISSYEEPKKSLIQALSERLLTTSNPLPKREKSITPPWWHDIFKSRDRYEILRHLTGERDVAKRVDYR